MSLAIPYLLDAAAEAKPDAVVHVAGSDLTTEDLCRRSIEGADRYLRMGCRPGDRIPLEPMTTAAQVIEALAATRIGLILCDEALPLAPRAGGPGVDREVAESRLWSEVPLAIVGSRTLTHGDVIEAAGGAVDAGPAPIRPIILVLRSIATALADPSSPDTIRTTHHQARDPSGHPADE